MRVRRVFPLQFLSRLLIAAVLLTGMASGPSALAMAGPAHHGTMHDVGSTGVADASGYPGSHHADCCPPQPMNEACVQACSAAMCAVPIMPVAQVTSLAPPREGAWPDLTMCLPGSGPEVETPPPRNLSRAL
jgi:hypothetical protein